MTDISADLAPDAFLHATLSGDATLAALVTGVSEHPAPLGATWPLVTFAPYGQASDVNSMPGDRVLTSGLWLVRVIGRETTVAQLAPAGARLDALLAGARGPTPFGTVYGVIRQNGFRLTETDDGVTYRHLGGVYRITWGA